MSRLAPSATAKSGLIFQDQRRDHVLAKQRQAIDNRAMRGDRIADPIAGAHILPSIVPCIGFGTALQYTDTLHRTAGFSANFIAPALVDTELGGRIQARTSQPSTCAPQKQGTDLRRQRKEGTDLKIPLSARSQVYPAGIKHHYLRIFHLPCCWLLQAHSSDTHKTRASSLLVEIQPCPMLLS